MNGIAGMKIEGEITFKNVEALFLVKIDLNTKPRNSGRNPGYQQRPKQADPDVIIDRHEGNANSDKQQTSSQQEAS